MHNQADSDFLNGMMTITIIIFLLATGSRLLRNLVRRNGMTIRRYVFEDTLAFTLLGLFIAILYSFNTHPYRIPRLVSCSYFSFSFSSFAWGTLIAVLCFRPGIMSLFLWLAEFALQMISPVITAFILQVSIIDMWKLTAAYYDGFSLPVLLQSHWFAWLMFASLLMGFLNGYRIILAYSRPQNNEPATVLDYLTEDTLHSEEYDKQKRWFDEPKERDQRR
ncbi:MAG: hypothetical protein ABFD54_13950 [Armatimonadota bacterium]|nr:hypothetical protein [bacterium]